PLDGLTNAERTTHWLSVLAENGILRRAGCRRRRPPRHCWGARRLRRSNSGARAHGLFGASREIVSSSVGQLDEVTNQELRCEWSTDRRVSTCARLYSSAVAREPRTML